MGGGKKPEYKPDDTKIVLAAEEVKKVNPLQAALDAQSQRYFDWNTGVGEYAGQPKDVTRAPGMEDFLDIYGNANALAARNRIGNPQAAFSKGAHPGFAKQLEQQNANERYNIRAAGLNEGLAGVRSQAYGLAGSGAEADFARKQAYANTLLNQSKEFYGRPKKKSGWDKFMDIAGLAVGGLSAAGGVKAFR